MPHLITPNLYLRGMVVGIRSIRASANDTLIAVGPSDLGVHSLPRSKNSCGGRAGCESRRNEARERRRQPINSGVAVYCLEQIRGAVPYVTRLNHGMGDFPL